MKTIGGSVTALGMIFSCSEVLWSRQLFHSDDVTIQSINFKSQYQTIIAGNLFIHNDLHGIAEIPAIIVDHPTGAVKEQSANLYATKLAEKGFVTVSLDLPF